MTITPSASYSITVRVEIRNRPGMLHEEYIIPSVFNHKVAPAVAREVVKAAHEAGIARRERRPARQSW